MNDMNCKALSILITLSFLLMMPLATTSVTAYNTLLVPTLTTPYPTITVNNDTQLSELISLNDWSGNGTEGDPYIIEGLSIDAHGASNAIFIGNTAQHLIIRGCLLSNTSRSLGTFPYNGNCGATIYNASNVTMEQNACTGNGRGLALYLSTSVTIKNNTCYGNTHGMGLYLSSGNYLVDNNCTSDGTDGIHFENSQSNVIDANRCVQNGRYGICLTSSSRVNTVVNNTCANNSNAGIRMSGTSNSNSVINNLIIGNLGYGVHILSSDDNEVYGNIISENRLATSEFDVSRVQAYDEGVSRWNSTAYGNRWGDWLKPDPNGDGIVDAAYRIDGGANYDALPISSTYVVITRPAEGETVNSSTVIVTGFADPDYLLSINGALVHVEANGSFSYPLNLVEGKNQIEAKSLNPLGAVATFVNVTYVNELRIELEELKDRMDEMDERMERLSEALSGAMEDLDGAIRSIGFLDAKLSYTQASLSIIREQLQTVEDELADCYDDLKMTNDEVTSLLDQVSTLRASLIEVRDSLNLTDEQAATLEASLNAAIADLSSAEDHLESLQSDVDQLKEDRLPLMLGIAGLVMGALALVLFTMVYTRKIKLP